MTGASSDRLPVTALALLSVAGFVTILTEALPAGLLPQITADQAASPMMIVQAGPNSQSGGCSAGLRRLR